MAMSEGEGRSAGGSSTHKKDWWKDFFSGLAVDMWRRALTEEHSVMEADFIQRTIRLKPPAALLDVPCGSGRLTIELASRGFTMTGIDISPVFLAEARAGAKQKNLNVSWNKRDMRDLPPDMNFEGAFCFGNSFGYFDDYGNARFLEAVYRVLRPGGRFMLDASSVAEIVIPQIKDHTEMLFGDIRFIEDNHYDHEQGRLETDYTFVKGDTTEKKFGTHRIHTYRELKSFLARTGFTNMQSFGSTGGEPFVFGSGHLYMVAERPLS